MNRKLRVERRRKRRMQRQALRDHATRGVYLHSTKVLDFGNGASVWGYWGCPRCKGVLDDLRGKA